MVAPAANPCVSTCHIDAFRVCPILHQLAPEPTFLVFRVFSSFFRIYLSQNVQTRNYLKNLADFWNAGIYELDT